MKKIDDNLVGRWIWLDYFDQNYQFERAFTPQSREVLRRITSDDGSDDWYLVKLGERFRYHDVGYADSFTMGWLQNRRRTSNFRFHCSGIGPRPIDDTV
jgi:hypothetical protein